MDIGVTIFLTDKSIGVVELAQALEERGFESLFVPEHTHIPTSRTTPYPGGGELPDEYRRTHDPFVMLGAAAAVTTNLKLGTGICLVAQHDTIALAKAVASVDAMSNGRFVFGIGYGWNVDEMQDHGVEPKQRRELVREQMLAMQSLWRDEEASFDGKYVKLPSSWAWPKPVQQPRPPVFIGGAPGPTLFRHIAEYADGWMPIGGAGVRDSLPALHGALEEAGRDPSTLDLLIFFSIPDKGKVEYYREMGVTRTVFGLPSAPADVVLPLLDKYAELLP
ncbi:MAG TPA: LLM class F420-dependent oxidoreductase [Acidimicrobiales bacterium]|nr:LLM class F420-dependent oxidoreductase [Acidimicrobiales bacterium]